MVCGKRSLLVWSVQAKCWDVEGPCCKRRHPEMLGADREITRTTRARDGALRSSRERAPGMCSPCPPLAPGPQDTKARGRMKPGTVMTCLWNGRSRHMNKGRSRVLGRPHRSPTPSGLVTLPPGRDHVGRDHWPPTGHWRQVTQSADQHTPPFNTPGPASRRRTSASQLVQSWPSLNTRAASSRHCGRRGVVIPCACH